MHVAIFVHIPDPLVGLALRVDNERPPSTIEDENAVVCTQTVSGKTIFLPISNLYLI